MTIFSIPYFGENVTLVFNCEAVRSEHVDCPISSKSTCLEKGLCSAGVFDVGDESRLVEIEYKINGSSRKYWKYRH